MRRYTLLIVAILIMCIISNAQQQYNLYEAYESAPGIVTVTWECDTTTFENYLFKLCKPKTDDDDTQYNLTLVKAFVNKHNVSGNKHYNGNTFSYTSDSILRNGTIIESHIDVYNECVIDNSTLKPGIYVIYITFVNKDNTYQHEYATPQILVHDNNTGLMEEVANFNNFKIVTPKGVFIIINNRIFTILGQRYE